MRERCWLSFGADVVKIETASGDPFRSYGSGFCVYNRGKRGLVLDLKHPEAKEMFLEMVAQADVVLDNSRLGVRERLGISYERLREVNPRIISLSITGYGTTGPQASQPGFDPLLQAQSGLMQAQGGDGGEPVFHGIPVNDVGSAAMSAFAIVGALYARTRTGVGQDIQTSLASQSVLAAGRRTHLVPRRTRAPNGRARLHRRQRAGALLRMCRRMDCACVRHGPRVAPRCARRSGYRLEMRRDARRTARWANSRPLVADVLRPLSVDDALTRLGEAGAPAAPVLTVDETYTDAFLEANNYYDSYVDPAFGPATGHCRLRQVRAHEDGVSTRAPPILGQHSIDVLGDFGVARGRIESLLRSGAVVQETPFIRRPTRRD